MSEEATESGERHTPVGPRSAINSPEGAIDAFVSHASHDAPIANLIVQALETHGLGCWIAPRDVTPGSHYADHIMSAISRAKVLVLVLSASALASKHVGKEIERASSKGRPIIALRTDAAPLTPAFEYFLSESQWIDVEAGGVAAVTAKLIEAVRIHVDSAVSNDPVLAPAAHLEGLRLRRWMILAVAVVSAVVFGYLVVAKVWLSKHAVSEPPAAALTAATAPAAAPISEKSIAVLPFTDMSEKKDQEYFSDGLSEELIDMLTKIPELRVPARTSSFYFKGKQATIANIAMALGVAHVLEGSVRKSGNTLRITAQLIRADNGYHVWSESYDRKLDDIFKIQDDIAGAVVTALRVHLLPLQQLAAQEQPRTGNLAAYNLYLQGRQSYNQGDAAGHQSAVTAFRAATALDPHYAAAFADLALAQFWVANDSDTVDDTIEDGALANAEKAIALAPGLAAGYSARGYVRAAHRFDFAGAQVDLDKAVALSPRDANVLHRSATLLAELGKLAEAITREEQALALDPLSEEICMRLAFLLVANQQLAQARPLYEKALAIAPNSTRARYHLGELELLEHRPEQALALFRQTALATFSLSGQARAEYSLGHVDASQRVLEQLIAEYGKGSAYYVARVYAWRGEKDQALEWVERAYEQRDPGLTFIKTDTDFRSLHGELRYKALLRKMNLPE